MLSSRLCVFLGTLTFALGGAQQSFAAKPPSASKLQARERQAKTACLSGDYAKGIAILAELFVDTNNAVHLFNQGRCYEQNVRYVEAAERFREYLRKDQDIPAAVRANVEQHIADCEALIDREKAKASPPPPAETKPVVEPVPAPAPVVQVAAPPPVPVVPPLVEAPAAEAPAEPVTEGKTFYKTWWFWTAAGTAIVAGTVTAFLLTRSAPDSCDGAGTRCVGVK